MPAYNDVPQSELPSSRALLRSTLIAAATALVILFTIVMPAEYGVDPTGIGDVLGLTEMGRIKVALEEEAEAAATTATSAAAAPVVTATSDSVNAPATGKTQDTSITLTPNQGREIKLVMRKGARVKYAWTTEGGPVNYDTHGDSVGDASGFYHGYGKGKDSTGDDGTLVAAFDGSHGWFWRNRSRQTVTVRLQTSGDYSELKEIK